MSTPGSFCNVGKIGFQISFSVLPKSYSLWKYILVKFSPFYSCEMRNRPDLFVLPYYPRIKIKHFLHRVPEMKPISRDAAVCTTPDGCLPTLFQYQWCSAYHQNCIYKRCQRTSWDFLWVTYTVSPRSKAHLIGVSLTCQPWQDLLVFTVCVCQSGGAVGGLYHTALTRTAPAVWWRSYPSLRPKVFCDIAFLSVYVCAAGAFKLSSYLLFIE
jgi:hypothetical protein